MADIFQLFNAINVWKQGDQRAPHKPLLILYALGRWQRGLTDVTFLEAEPQLTELLQRFGPKRRSDHPEQPFWRLQKDKVWFVRTPAPLPLKTGDDIPKVGALRSPDVVAGFTQDVREALTSNRHLAAGIAASILAEHFPESYHEDLLDAVGLVLEPSPVQQRKRDPNFRHRVLKAYEYRCAVCGFDVRLGSVSIALDAAHIRWHQAGGPDTEINGLALCVLHHKVFDLGAFTVSDGVVLVSDQANGTTGFAESLMAYHGKMIRPPQHPDWMPEPKHLEWHGREVFKGDARHRG
ncbi:MAG: HNH endonuclease [Planctomycetes bacterium]|nr:HNH endonuclease [Planctomycetota bacterium]